MVTNCYESNNRHTRLLIDESNQNLLPASINFTMAVKLPPMTKKYKEEATRLERAIKAQRSV